MKKITLLIFCGLFAVPMAVWSQPVSEELEGVRVYGRPGIPKITIYVWGGQTQAGVWLVEEDTDLIEFLSISARGDVTIRQPERRSETFIKIFRGTSQRGNDPFFEANVNDLFSRQESYPSLQDGDILVVETRVRREFTWRDLSQVVGTLTSGISLYLLLSGDR